MKKKLFKNCFILSIFAFLLLTCGLFINFNPVGESFSAIQDTTTYSTYQKYWSSYKDFSFDYLGETLPSEYCMRDEYLLYTEQQNGLGLCWDFTSTKIMTSTIMKATGEYLDFSEAWTSAALVYGTQHNELQNYNLLRSEDYLSGEGGWFTDFDMVAQRYGVVLEQDFRYDDVYEITSANADKYFEMYSQYASKDLRDNLEAGRFSIYSNRSDKETIKNSMKSHILQHGALFCSVYWDTVATGTYLSNQIHYKIPSVGRGTGAHAVTIVGWDDNISFTHNGKAYHGAWIILNSHGNMIRETTGNNGMMYLFYDDTDYINSYFWGYKYKEQAKASLYYFDKISQSNASYTTNLKGAYYGDRTAEEAQTKQKNIFYNQSDIDITYSYTISSDVEIDKISILRNQKDVSLDFDITHNEDDDTINIVGSDIPIGRYKVLIEYSNNTDNAFHYNEFCIYDGTEINYVQYAFQLEPDGEYNFTSVAGNGNYQLFNAYDIENREIVFATRTTTDTILIRIVFASYDRIKSASLLGIEDLNNVQNDNCMFELTYDTRKQTEYDFVFTTYDGIVKTLTLRFVELLEEDEDEFVWTKFIYDVDGGDNSGNEWKMLVNKNEKTLIQNPTRLGYVFKGWYYSSDFSSSSKLASNAEGQYFVEYTKLHKETNPTMYYSSFVSYWNKQINMVFLYAQWEKYDPVEVSFVTNGGSAVASIIVQAGERMSSPVTTKTGYTLVGWFKEAALLNEWIFNKDVVVENMTLYAKFVLEDISNISLTADRNRIFIGETFTLTLTYDHTLLSQADVEISWKKNGVEVAKNTSTSYSETLNSIASNKYVAIITLTIEGEEVTASTEQITVAAIYDLCDITITYLGGYEYSITDQDSYQSNYHITVYKENGLIDTSIASTIITDKSIDIKAYITTSGTYYIGVVKEYDGQENEEVQSSTICIYSISFANVDSFDDELYLAGESVSEPSNPAARKGYEFAGWYSDSQCNVVFQWPYIINSNTVVYAKWNIIPITVHFETNGGSAVEDIKVEINSLIESPLTTKLGYNFDGWYKESALTNEWNFDEDKVTDEITLYARFTIMPILNATLVIDNPIQSVGSEYTIIADFSHPLKDKGTFTVLWEKDGSMIAQNTSLEYTDVFEKNDTRVYRATINFTVDGHTISAITNSLTVNSKYALASITIIYNGDYKFTIVDPDSYVSTYRLIIYNQDGQIGSSSTIIKDIDITNYINAVGSYYIGAIKEFAGQSLDEVLSTEIETVSFALNGETAIFEKGTTISSAPVYQQKIGYNFNGWYLDRGCTDACEWPLILNSNTSIYAKYTLKNIKVGSLNSLDKKYDGQIFRLSVNASHELIGGKYTYAWYKQGENALKSTSSQMSFKNVKDSGQYWCLVTYTINGDITSASTNIANINIAKAAGKITALNSQTFTFSKKPVVPIYTLNNNEQKLTIDKKPINVGTYSVKLTLAESDNYSAANKTVTLKIVPIKLVVKIDNKKSLWLFNMEKLTYEITEGILLEGDSLEAVLNCDASKNKIGKFKITMTANNNNYEIEVIEGVYEVSAGPHFIIGGSVILLVLSNVLIFVFQRKRKKKMGYI